MKLDEAVFRICTGRHDSTVWENRDVTWAELTSVLSEKVTTNETPEEFEAMPKEQQDAVKGSRGGWIGGETVGGHKVTDIVNRTILTIDVDHPDGEDTVRQLVKSWGITAMVHETHRPNRWRVIVPLTRPVDAKEYGELARACMSVLPGSDPVSDQVNRVMFFPTTSRKGSFRTGVYRGRFMDPSEPPSSWVMGLDPTNVKLMDRTVEEIISSVGRAAHGERNNVFSAAVYALAATGRLDGDTGDRLRAAAEEAGLSRSEIAKTYASGSKAGKAKFADKMGLFFDGENIVPAEKSSSYRLQRASDTEMIEPRELWYGMLPLGALVVISGMGGIGKSTLDAWLAAKASNGGMEGDLSGPLEVLLVMDEDDWNRDTVPKLYAAGANMSKVSRLLIKRSGEETEEHILQLPSDVGLLQKVITENDIKVVVLDVVTSMMESGLDPNKQADVRRLLNPLLRVAQDTDSTIICVNHWKKQGDRISAMISGSMAYRDTARCVWAVLTDGESRYVKIDKYNRSPKQGATYQFDIASVEIPGWKRSVGAVVNWRESAADAEDILSSAASPQQQNASAEMAVEWLTQFFSDTPVSTWKTIRVRAAEDGFTEKQIRDARIMLKCDSMKYSGLDGKTETYFFQKSYGDAEAVKYLMTRGDGR